MAHITGGGAGRALTGRTGAATDTIAVILSGPNPVAGVNESGFSDGPAFGSLDYDYEATVGLVGGDDFFEVIFFSSLVPNEQVGFTAQDASGSYGNSGTAYVPVAGIADFAGTTKPSDVGLLGTVLGPTDDYEYSDTADFLINAVPEPASMAVWAAGLWCSAGVSFRRRKK